MSRKMIHAAVVAALLTAPAAPALARPDPAPASQSASVSIDKARIDAALKAMVDSGRAVGVSALVWQDGRERYFGTAGMADREAGKPMRRDTLVQIFSMTKPVTGVALMQLWEQGKFGLDDPLSRYLPEFAGVQVIDGKGGLRPPARPIVIRDLLRHTAGFSYGMRDTAADAAFKAADPLGLRNDLTEFGRRLAKVPLMYDPGERWSYSAAVDVQALLVEKLSGQPFEAYVKAHILDPLGMKDTGWTQPESAFSRLAAVYNKGADGKLAKEDPAETRRMNFDPTRRMTMGGAGLVASIDDYARFTRMLLGGGTLDGVQILRPSTVRLMATDQLDPRVTDRWWLPSKGSVGFGLDFAVRVKQPRTAAENRGAVGEFFWDGRDSTLFWVDPVNRLTAVFFVQTFPFDGTLHHDLRAAVYGPDYLGPKGD
ncbi:MULTISPECIES: serine hydrolase domain-containing protein [Caulobacter]|uniref:Penicillin-binding protein, beta-lactamase class C n=1 Tax=Caulobacter vibrioides OR37 TaxID=1292034 RepID=R0D2A7_CAUVI|nr:MULTISPECIES: serine hydrolase domain-containing protein [Caulobacter]ENZ82741.1 penicillin-binding protein, beta-lactamase class C [Caulobacter vibrioides OR37]MBQ1563237.1 beta-lactamase family protein [Caulobacter sp.]